MAESFDSFNEETQRAKVKAGFKGGPFMNSPSLTPSLTFIDAVEPEVKAKFMQGEIKAQPMEDPWYSRRK